MTRSKKILNIATAIVVGLLVACTAASFLIRARTQPKVETVQPTQYSFALGEEWVDVKDRGRCPRHSAPAAVENHPDWPSRIGCSR